MATIFIKNAKAIVTADNSDNVFFGGNILIRDGVIDFIGTDIPEMEADAEIIDASGCYVYPGLINTHHHLFQTFTRNLPAVQRLELFPWLIALYKIWKELKPEHIYYSSLTGIGELVKYGCTTVMDHHYVFPREGSDTFIDEQFRAAEKLGVRFVATRGSMDRGESDGGLPPDVLVQDIDTILADCARVVERYHDTSRFSMRNVALAPCSPFSVTTDLLSETSKLARQLNVRMHTHLCETEDEERFCLETHGVRPLAYMEKTGWVGEDVWFAHGIWFNDEELQLLADTGTGVAHCPVSNMKLASGVCRVPDMLKRGVPIGLAVDGSASNDCSNLLAEIRASYLVNRLTYSHNAPDGYDILKIATRGSAALLGRNDIGQLAAGMAADLFLLDAALLELVGTGADPGALLGTVGYARPAKLVMVNGRVVAEDGKLSGIDEAELMETANRSAAGLLDGGEKV